MKLIVQIAVIINISIYSIIMTTSVTPLLTPTPFHFENKVFEDSFQETQDNLQTFTIELYKEGIKVNKHNGNIGYIHFNFDKVLN